MVLDAFLAIEQMNIKNKIGKVDKLRLLISVFLTLSILLFFWIAFQQINQQVDKFNHYVLNVTNKTKANFVQSEFDDLEKIVTLLTKSFEDDNLQVISYLRETDSLLKSITLLSYWKEDGKQFSSSKSDLMQRYSNLTMNTDTVRFLNVGNPQLEIYRKFDTGIALFVLDLYKFHDYFKEQKNGGQTYFELYNSDGVCLMHPDSTRIGKIYEDKIAKLSSVDDTIMESDYLGTAALRNSFDVVGIFDHHKLFVYAPLAVTDVEVRDIGGVSFLLSISAVVLLFVLLMLLNRERTKSARLAMNNLAYQKEEALLRFENLKRKVDPHFLFNALGSLQQLIGKDPVLAKTFVSKMARVYRKFLNSNLSGLTTIREEVLLAKEYYFLQKVRFGPSLLDIDFDIGESFLTKQIPRYSMQIVIENALKHNEFGDENPLEILIYIENDNLCISNTFRPRSVKEESSGYGLSLIANVYDYYHIKGFRYGVYEEKYQVCLPMLPVE